MSTDINCYEFCGKVRLSPDNAFWAEKYAMAFLNVFYSEIPDGIIEKFLTLYYFFELRKSFFINISSPSMSHEKKHISLKSLGQGLDLNEKDISLLTFLSDRGDILKLGPICKQIAKISANRRDEVFCEVFTSDPLDSQERKSIMNFLEKSLEKKPIVSFHREESLLSGIRIESDSFLYEKSVKSRFRQALVTLRSMIQ